MKKNMLFLMLFVGSALLFSCSKSSPSSTTTPATDARDKFVGTWSGTEYLYEAGALVDSGLTVYTVTKDASNSSRIIINESGDLFPATVSGSNFTVSNYTSTDADFSYVYNIAGSISGNILNYNGTVVETDLVTSDVTTYTLVGNLAK